MNDLGEIKKRVNAAVDQLSKAQDTRRDQHDRLIQFLADLEVKIDARHEALSYCRTRIADLEQTNNQLSELLNDVVKIIDTCTANDPGDPIFRASRMAADLVKLCDSDPDPDTDEGGDPVEKSRGASVTTHPDETHDVTTGSPEATTEGASAGRGVSERQERPVYSYVMKGRFEDVSEEELELETLLDERADESDMPSGLLVALRAARASKARKGQVEGATSAPARESTGAGLADTLAKVADAVRSSHAEREPEAAAVEPVAEPLSRADAEAMDIPGVDTVVDIDVVEGADQPATAAGDPAADPDEARVQNEQVRDSDIRALMGRIQNAADKARASSGAAPGTHSEPSTDEAGTG